MTSVRRWGATGWLRALWAWWVMLGLVGLALLVVAYTSSVLFTMRNQEAEMLPRVQAVREAFVGLRTQQSAVPLGVLGDFQHGSLTLDALRGARVAGEPFFKLYVVDGQGKKAFADDREDDAPAWMVRWVAAQPVGYWGSSLVMVRPVPDRQLVAGAPTNFLFWASRNPEGQFLLVPTDLDYVFGPWLHKQLEAHHLTDAKVSVLSTEETAKLAGTPDTTTNDQIHVRFNASPLHSAWSFRIATFAPDNKAPFQQVRLKLDTFPGLQLLTRAYGLALAALALVMASFAAALFLAGRSVRHELALANARANFTAMVSHELKTPVAAIRLYGEILVNKLVDDPAKQDEYHQIIMDESARLQRLIENLLDLGKIERGARTYELAPQDANALVEEAIAQALAATPADADYRLIRELGAVPPIKADRDAARQALSNLVHNALKYGGKPPHVTVATRAEGNEVVVEIMDRGPGIPPERRQAIFEPYVRLEDEARRETQGTGLGLALVKGYMEGQGGSVGVGDRPGGGSTFTLRFPAAS